MSQQNWIGQTLGGRYEIVELLGQGGMSAVYKANDPNLRRVVAIKLIHPHLSSNPEFVRRFEEEAAAVASLRHPNIIQVYDFNHDRETYYIVFEFVPGESLQGYLNRLNDAGRKMPYEQSVQTAASVGEALDYAHSRGMIHRDIKPANVMLNVHGQAILMDFGVVKMVGGDTHTATGAVVGTARYMSPEQIRGEKIDSRSDLYSLGVTMFEMVGARPPFQADSALTVMMMHVNDPVPNLHEIRQDVPNDLVFIINKALAKNRAQRYQTANELAKDLRGAQLVAPITRRNVVVPPIGLASQAATVPEARPSAQPVPSRTGSQSAAPPKAAVPQQAVTDSGKSDRNRIVIFGGLGAALLLIICIAALAIIFGSGLLSGRENGQAQGTETAIAGIIFTGTAQSATTPSPSATLAATATEAEVASPSPSATLPTTIMPTATATAPAETTPTVAESPTTVATLTATYTPQPTEPPPPTEPVGPQVRINTITSDGTSYIVDYTPIGYTPQLPGTHIHFFWNTVPPQNAGVGPTAESWILYGGPNPFGQYKVSDRPAAATQMCALVANPDHTIILNTGNCANLP